jgi:hypothetical protein
MGRQGEMAVVDYVCLGEVKDNSGNKNTEEF